MTAILFAPHADDESLFAFYTMLREDAHVCVLLDSVPSREDEFRAAMGVTRRNGTFSRIWEGDPDWNTIAMLVAEEAFNYDTVIAPAYEAEGHEQHNQIALMVDSLRHPNVIRYVTYRRGHGRTVTAKLVQGTAIEQQKKLEALSCYQSQIDDPRTRDWFPSGRYHTLNEWLL